MREINKPEQMASSDVKPTPEQLRAVESRKREIAAKLDSMPTDIYGSTFPSDSTTEKRTSDSGPLSSNNEFFRFRKESQTVDPCEKYYPEYKNSLENELLPSAELEVKSHIRTAGLDKYISPERLEEGLVDKTKVLFTHGMQKECGKSWCPGMAGFSDGKRICVDATVGEILGKETGVHEFYHHLSANDTHNWYGKVIESRRGISINDKDVGLNEALTQKYTLDTLRDNNPNYDNPYSGYAVAADYLDDLYTYEGNADLFNKAYFQNRPDDLREHFDGFCGDGFYDKLSEKFNIITGNTHELYSDEEIDSMYSDIEDMIGEYDFYRRNGVKN